MKDESEFTKNIPEMDEMCTRSPMRLTLDANQNLSRLYV